MSVDTALDLLQSAATEIEEESEVSMKESTQYDLSVGTKLLTRLIYLSETRGEISRR